MPVYNEADTIVQIIDDVLDADVAEVDLELVIVESNSTDGSRELVCKYEGHPDVRIVLEEEARGKGHAMREAFRVARGDIFLIQDGDLEYSVDDYPALITPIVDGRADFVLGTRYVAGEPMRWIPEAKLLSRFMNGAHRAFAALFNVTYGTHLRDPFTMFKVFRRDAITGVRFVCDRFDFDWELMAKLVRLGYQPLEVPVWYQARGYHGGKKIRAFRDPPTWVVACVRFRFSRLYD
jgi:glycosyltransferase involved in cell wall biosynthesis